MASPKALKVRSDLVEPTLEIAKVCVMIAVVLTAGLSASPAQAAPPPLETVTPAIKSFCTRSFTPDSPTWVLCVGQQTQGYLDFTKAYPETTPPVMEGFDKCQAAYAPSGNWALLNFCASERLRAADQLK